MTYSSPYPGSSNAIAQRESRRFHFQDSEWILYPELLSGALKTLNFQPEIDLFVSRLNKQLLVFLLIQTIPCGIIHKCLHYSWANKKFYCFHPFSCILQLLQKIIQDQATCMVVVPDWPMQVQYPLLTSLLIVPPVKLRPSKNLLRLPATPTTLHPLHKNVSLRICLLTATTCRNRIY